MSYRNIPFPYEKVSDPEDFRPGDRIYLFIDEGSSYDDGYYYNIDEIDIHKSQIEYTEYYGQGYSRKNTNLLTKFSGFRLSDPRYSWIREIVEVTYDPDQLIEDGDL